MTTQPAPIEAVPPVAKIDEENLALLRDFRSEIQDLRMVLDSVGKGETTIQANAKYITKTMSDISALMDKIKGDDDSISHLRNLFEQMNGNPLLVNPGRKAAAESQLHYLNLLQSQFRKIEFYVGWLTIPDRVNKWLEQARPGYYIPFHIIFEDEICEPEDRAKILSLLAWSPQAVRGGYVNAASGLIYKYSNRLRDRFLSAVYILLGFAVATGLVWGAFQVNIPGLLNQKPDISASLGNWMILLIGLAVHVGNRQLQTNPAAGTSAAQIRHWRYSPPAQCPGRADPEKTLLCADRILCTDF